MNRSALRVLGMAAMLAAAAAVAACATPDRRTDQERRADEAITRSVKAALASERYVDADHIDVAANRGVVRLSGLVATDVDLREVLRTSAAVPGVRSVVDDLEIIQFGGRRR
jgi:osmotically-inducible protein OsmY